MEVKDRIKDLRRVHAKDLHGHPRNFRRHPERQQTALRSVLESIGIADVLIAREDDTGKLWLIDGHLRSGLDPNVAWPTVVLDVTEEEADTLLATVDHISSLADVDSELFKDLLDSLEGVHMTGELVDTIDEMRSGLDWSGRSPADADAIGEYSEDSETFSVRVNGVRSDHKQIIVDAVKAAVEGYGYGAEAY